MTNLGSPLALFILDGVADNPNPKGNAVYHASTPTLDSLRKCCPSTQLETFGMRVGLPEGQMGNSEVGHLNIGAGRVVKQELTLINESIAKNSLVSNVEFKALCEAASATEGAALHLIGLASRGGVHSSMEHLQALIREAVRLGVKRLFVHAITDGRDRPPQAAAREICDLQEFIDRLDSETDALTDIRIVSVIGRYFAMDRDTRWDRTKKAYRLFTEGRGENFADACQALEARKQSGEYDEFLEPIFLRAPANKRAGTVQDGDAILFFNFRADRMRQIVRTFFETDFKNFERGIHPKLASAGGRRGLAGLTEYDETFPIGVLFRPETIIHHLGEVVSARGLSQLRLAETEKYPHVTYFFNGGEEKPYPQEERMLVPSPRDVPTYDLKPEMSANQVTDKLVEAIESKRFDLFIVNYANCDMVGHTGNFDAAVQAVETVDRCLGRALGALGQVGARALVTADHGNADQMINYETGEPHTFHTTYPVPFFVVDKQGPALHLRSGGALCDIAPTICELLGISQPVEMTGQSLLLSAGSDSR